MSSLSQKLPSSSQGVTATTARQRLAPPGRLQEEALAQLPPNTLYIVLHILDDPPQTNHFHWSFYLHEGLSGGTKYHVQNPSNKRWAADHAHSRGVFKSLFLCALIQIATVPLATHTTVDQLMRSRDDTVNDIPGVSCRVWLFAILQDLIRKGIVRCDNIDALQEECMTFGTQAIPGAVKNDQPRPVFKSRCCGE